MCTFKVLFLNTTDHFKSPIIINHPGGVGVGRMGVGDWVGGEGEFCGP